MPKFAPVGHEDPMNTFCRMVVDTKYEDLPDNLVNCAKRYILGTLGNTIGGSSMEGIPAVVDLVKERGGKQESIIPFYGGKVPASEAALAIGPMSRAMDLGDFHEGGGHCSEYIVSSMLAATGLKNRVSGREFITSYVVGAEILLRIGIAYGATQKGSAFGQLGGHPIFGCVAALGGLLGMSQDELENAQGIVWAMTQPHFLTVITEGTLMQRMGIGFICQDAINACLLAKRGITGPRRGVLAGPKGYLSLAKWETEPGALTESLGERWQISDLIMKPNPSCGGTHTGIYGILDQMKEHDFKAEDIAKIDIEVSPLDWNTVCTPQEVKWNPQTVPECQYSLPYTVATAAYDGDVFLGSYTPQAIERKEIRDLMTRISAKEDASLPGIQAARIHTMLKDGRVFSKEYIYAKGHPKNPFTEQELIDNFKKCVLYSAYKLSGTVADSLIQTLLNLEKVDDVVTALLLPLTPR